MAPGTSSTNGRIREFYAPRVTKPSITQQRQSMPRVEHQKPLRPTELHKYDGPASRTEPDDNDQVDFGCIGEIKNYKAGDEFVLLWKWVDEFMDKRRAKKNSSKSHAVNKSVSRRPEPTPSPSRKARQGPVPRPATALSPEAVRRQAIAREDLREYKAQRHTPWGELLYLYQNWKDQQAKKTADRAGQRKREDEPSRGRSTNRREPPLTIPPPLNQALAADSQPSIAKRPIPVHNKKRGEVQKHTVKIIQLPPVHNSVHLQHTPSNNYRTNAWPARSQNNKSTRDTRFSDFLHHERGPPSRETHYTNGVTAGDNGFVRNSRFSSILDPAKAIKKAKEVEKAKGPKCYICSSMNCPGGYRDNITNLWMCAACQQRENRGPVECCVCGEPNFPDTRYADNGLWLCSSVSNLSELSPPPYLSSSVYIWKC